MISMPKHLHDEPTDEVREFASLYALGALSPEESAAYEAHLSAGCRVCQREVASFHEVTGAVGFSVTSPAADSVQQGDRTAEQQNIKR